MCGLHTESWLRYGHRRMGENFAWLDPVAGRVQLSILVLVFDANCSTDRRFVRSAGYIETWASVAGLHG